MFFGIVGGVDAVPVTGCGTLSTAGETYVLSNDLISTTGTCITIGADNITLDGVNFSITGSGSGDGVYISGKSGITIKNLRISGFGYDGIAIYSSPNNTILDNTASNNDFGGIYLESSSSNVIKGNTFSDNTREGIAINLNSNSNTITDNTVTGNSASGNCSILSGLINESYGGIAIYDSDSNNVSYNTVSNDKCDGIALYQASSSNTITGNDVNNNGFGGIVLDKSPDNTIEGNTISSNNDDGIALYSSTSNTIKGNTASNSKTYGGIYLDDSRNNDIIGNILSNNNWEGISLNSSSSSNTITGNTASGNGKYGIYLKSSSSNSIYNNNLNNTNNAYDNGSNSWNTTKIPGTNIVGGPYLSGNFWAKPDGTGFSETCVDVNSDGFCDSSYTLASGNVDYLPLVFTTPPSGGSACPVFNNNTLQNYSTIQEAIDNATDGDTILVCAGNYSENVDVDKSVNLIGAGADVTVVSASNSNDHVFNVTADWVNVSGFMVRGATNYLYAGIYLYGVDYANISNNNASNNGRGIYLESSSYNTIAKNNVTATTVPKQTGELTEEFEKEYITLGAITGTASSVTMVHVDSDLDGTLDSVAMLYNDGSRFELIDFNGTRKWTEDVQPPLNNIGALTTADLDGDGISSEIIVGAQNVTAFDSNGQELWSFKPAASTYSLASGDINDDGKDEIIIGGFKKVYALDSAGNHIWSFPVDDTSDAIVVADLDSNGKPDSIVAGGLYAFYVLDLDGKQTWSKGTGDSGRVSTIITADLNSDGYRSDIVVGQQDGTIVAYNYKGEILWTYKKSVLNDPKLYPFDIEGKGYLNHILVKSVESVRVYVLTPGGQDRFLPIYAKSIAPVDFDSDGRTESLIAGSSDKIFAYNSNRVEQGYYMDDDKKVSPYNRTGADALISIDYDGDGFLDDVMGVIGETNTLFILEHKNTISHNKFGIYLHFSSSNTITDNNASNNADGIYLDLSISNIITNNTINSNTYDGIRLNSSSSNTIYNNYFNNTANFRFFGSNTNDWNTIKQAGTNIVGGPYLGGNLWAKPDGTGFSETCVDADDDGICDSNYVLASGNVDYLPLITPYHKGEQSITGSANLIYPVDFDGDSILDTAIIGTDSNAVAIGDVSWDIKVSNVYGVSSIDLDIDGRLDEVIIAGRDIVAADSSGEIWRINDTNGYSVASVDLDGDGKVDEFVVGTGKKIIAFDRSGTSIWEYPYDGKQALYLTAIEKRIVFGEKASSAITFLNYDGGRIKSTTTSSIITGMVAFDLKQKGSLNGVAVESLDGKVTAFDSAGTERWTYKGKKIEAEDRLSKSLVFATDRYSKGTKDHILFNQDRNVYWINPKGSGSGNPYIDSAISPADFDGDGIYDDIVISRERKGSGEGQIEAFNSKFKKLGEFNDTGASSIIVLGSGMDSKIIAVNDYFNKIYTILVELEDTTTTTTTTSTSTTTTTLRRSSGGSGGGGGSPISFDVWINNVSSGQTFSLEIDDEDIQYLKGLSLTAKQAIYSSKLAITDLDKKPWSSIEEPDATIFRYFKVNYDKDNYIESASFKFSINKSWLKDNDIDPYKFSLYRYTTIWEKLDTKILGEDDENIYLEAITPGFSYFSLGGTKGSGYRSIKEEAASAPVEEETIKPQKIETPTPATPAETPKPEQEPEKAPEGEDRGGICGPTAVVLLAMLVLLFRRKKISNTSKRE